MIEAQRYCCSMWPQAVWFEGHWKGRGEAWRTRKPLLCTAFFQCSKWMSFNLFAVSGVILTTVACFLGISNLQRRKGYYTLGARVARARRWLWRGWQWCISLRQLALIYSIAGINKDGSAVVSQFTASERANVCNWDNGCDSFTRFAELYRTPSVEKAKKAFSTFCKRSGSFRRVINYASSQTKSVKNKVVDRLASF